MSFLTSVRATSRSTLRPTYALSSHSSSAFHSSAIRPTLKESDKSKLPSSSTSNSQLTLPLDRDDLPNYYEAHKEEQVKNAEKGKGKWSSELASNSEAEVSPSFLFLLSMGCLRIKANTNWLNQQVKADRGEIESDDKTFEGMQERTKNLLNGKGPLNKPQ